MPALRFPMPADVELVPEIVCLAACGDLILHDYNLRLCHALGAQESPGLPYGDAVAAGLARSLRHLRLPLGTADIAFLNLETVCSDDTDGSIDLVGNRFDYRSSVAAEHRPSYTGAGGAIGFNAPPEIARAIRQTGFSVASTANNHAYDRGSPGIAATLRHLESAGLVCVGTSAAADTAFKVVRRNGMHVAFLAFTEGINGLPAGVSPGGIDTIDDEMLEHVRAARDADGVDGVVVSLHWGAEYAASPWQEQSDLAVKIFQAGADVILGHHPHVLQPPEVMYVAGKRRLCIYSLGTLYSHCDTLESRTSAIAFIGLQKGARGGCHVRGVTFLPLYANAYYDPSLEKHVFEPMPLDALGAPFEAMQHVRERLGVENLCSSIRVQERRIFVPYVVAGGSSFADLTELDLEGVVAESRRELLGRHLGGSDAETPCGGHGDAVPMLVRSESLRWGAERFELPRLRYTRFVGREALFGCFFLFEGPPDVDRLLRALDTAAKRFPAFFARSVTDGTTLRLVVDDESAIAIRVLQSKLRFDDVQAQANCAAFRRSLAGDFPAVVCGRSACGINLIELTEGCVCATSMLHSVTDLLGFFDFLSAWARCYGGAPPSEIVGHELPPESFRLSGPAPHPPIHLRRMTYAHGDAPIASASCELTFRCAVTALKVRYGGSSLRDVMCVALARTLARYGLPEHGPSDDEASVQIAVVTSLRKWMPDLRRIVGSPDACVDVGYPAAGKVLATDDATLLSYTCRTIETATSYLADLAGKMPELASPFVSMGAQSDVAVRGILNMSTIDIADVRLAGSPSFFARLRAAGPWEMLVYRGGGDAVFVQLGIPDYAEASMVRSSLIDFVDAEALACPRVEA